MVSTEIGAVLSDLDVGAQAGLSAIKLWMGQARRDGLKPGALLRSNRR